VDAVDAGLGRITKAIVAKGGAVIVTADHGNCELMKDPATGEPHTSHTTNRVPLLYVDEVARASGNLPQLRGGGRICDVAPTLLAMMGVAQPKAMTGRSLFEDA
jgi:2,3-bisphosphoglycerate-independent phosphoglycerate mutase